MPAPAMAEQVETSVTVVYIRFAEDPCIAIRVNGNTQLNRLLISVPDARYKYNIAKKGDPNPVAVLADLATLAELAVLIRKQFDLYQ